MIYFKEYPWNSYQYEYSILRRMLKKILINKNINPNHKNRYITINKELFWDNCENMNTTSGKQTSLIILQIF